MPNVHFFRPVDPPNGINRLIDELRNSLQCADYNKFFFAVAFAKVGPLLRLTQELEDWKDAKKETHGIFGIDLKGTSTQALDFAMSLFNSVHVTHNPTRTTFHPKIYLFQGDSIARAYIGSQNMTVGGLELNFEAGVRVDIDLRDSA
jgi:HKD family nuclease